MIQVKESEIVDVGIAAVCCVKVSKQEQHDIFFFEHSWLAVQEASIKETPQLKIWLDR